MLSNHLILCHPLLLLPSIFPSIRVFSNESVLHIRWPKYWSFSFSISPSNEYSGLISFKTDQFYLLVVKVTFKSPLQHYNLKASILQHSLLATPWMVGHQAPLSIGLLCPPPRYLSNPGIGLGSLKSSTQQASSLPLLPLGKPQSKLQTSVNNNVLISILQ